MKKFLAVFFANPESPGAIKWHAQDPVTKKELEQTGMAAWKKWVEVNSKSLSQMGSPLGKTKLVNGKGVSDTKNELTAYTVVEAETHEAAAKLFLNHPHFAIFPGDRIEIMECLPIPGM
jgi:hypothetical protein